MSRWAPCPFTGKRGYMNRADAERELHRAQGEMRRLRRKGTKGITRREQRVYGDCECGRWHVTSRSAKSWAS